MQVGAYLLLEHPLLGSARVPRLLLPPLPLETVLLVKEGTICPWTTLDFCKRCGMSWDITAMSCLKQEHLA